MDYFSSLLALRGKNEKTWGQEGNCNLLFASFSPFGESSKCVYLCLTFPTVEGAVLLPDGSCLRRVAATPTGLWTQDKESHPASGHWAEQTPEWNGEAAYGLDTRLPAC